jgi:hypothetical protein
MNQKLLTVLRLFNLVTQTTTTNGSAVDLQGYVNPGGRNMKAYVTGSSTAGTTPNLNVKIQESTATGSGWGDITGAAFAAVTATTPWSEEIHFVATKRYIRAVTTFDANTTSASYCVIALAENRTV